MERDQQLSAFHMVILVGLVIAGIVVLWKGGPVFYSICAEKAATALQGLDPYGRNPEGPRFSN